MRHLAAIALVVVAAIHLIPVSGVLGASQLHSLYGLAIADPDLLILMRHRAVLFGMIGVLLLLAAFLRALQPAAFAAGFASVLSFLLLAVSGAPYNEAIARVVFADLVALASLLVGFAAFLMERARLRKASAPVDAGVLRKQ